MTEKIQRKKENLSATADASITGTFGTCFNCLTGDSLAVFRQAQETHQVNETGSQV